MSDTLAELRADVAWLRQRLEASEEAQAELRRLLLLAMQRAELPAGPTPQSTDSLRPQSRSAAQPGLRVILFLAQLRAWLTQ